MSNIYAEILKDTPLAFWRMSDTPFNETISRYNLCPNPSLQVDNTGYTTERYGSSFQHTDFKNAWYGSAGFSGNGFLRGEALQSWPYKSWIFCPDTAVTAGESYVVSFHVRVNRAMNVAVNVESLRSDMSVVGLVVGSDQWIPANTWTRLSQIHTVPAAGVKMRGLVVVNSLQQNDNIDVDAVLYERTTVLNDWFDGNSTNAVWLGTAGKSQSRQDTVVARRYMDDETGVYRGTYSPSGVTFNVPAYPLGGDGASQFAPAGEVEVIGGNGVWDLGTDSGQWTIEFLARFDNDLGGNVLETDRWKIATVGTNRIGYMAMGSEGTWSAPAPWTDNAWHHYVVTSNNGLLTFYVDGTDVLTFTDTGLNASGSGNLRLATSSTAVTLDEIAIYPRSLTDGQVTAHYLGLQQEFGEIVTATYVEPRQKVLTLVKGSIVSQQMTVTVQYTGGGVATPINVVWSSSNTAVVSVSASGLVRALTQGSAAITATLPDLGTQAFTGVSVMPPDPLPGEGRALYSADSEKFTYDSDGHLISTTDEYWEVDPGRFLRGEWIYDSPVSLATLAFNISTLAGREGIPIADGENLRTSAVAGRRWLPKTPDQKTLSLGMWVQGTTEEGDIPQDIYLRTQFWENYNMLKQLFAVWDRQLLLRRRVPTRYGIITQQTWVEPSSSMDLEPTGPMRATFTIDLLMNDPFWRALEQSSDPVPVAVHGGQRRYPRTYPLEYGSFGQTGIFTLFNDGTHEARLIAEIHGAVENPIMFNMDTNERFRLETDVELAAQDVIEVDFYYRTIKLKGSGSRYWWLDRTTDWLHARPGYQRLQFSHEGYAETPYIVWRWEPAYL